MRRTCRSERARSRGFTLVEAVIVITVTGVVAGIVAQFIVAPVQAHLAATARAALVEHADLALRRIGRDLRGALPNSVRVNAAGTAIELIPATGAARYATEGSGALQFGVTDTGFDVVGPALTLASAQQLVFYNLGPTVPDADAYADNGSAGAQATSNRRQATNGAGAATTITLSSAAPLPATDYAPPHRVFAVSAPVSYRCDTAAGTLTRYQGYGFQAAQPDPPSGGTSAVVAKGVTACSFGVEPTVVAARAALVNLALRLSGTTSYGSESITLHHAVHVDNQP
jgi:MSHA biogenesis protein MshO